MPAEGNPDPYIAKLLQGKLLQAEILNSLSVVSSCLETSQEHRLSFYSFHWLSNKSLHTIRGYNIFCCSFRCALSTDLSDSNNCWQNTCLAPKKHWICHKQPCSVLLWQSQSGAPCQALAWQMWWMDGLADWDGDINCTAGRGLRSGAGTCCRSGWRWGMLSYIAHQLTLTQPAKLINSSEAIWLSGAGIRGRRGACFKAQVTQTCRSLFP